MSRPGPRGAAQQTVALAPWVCVDECGVATDLARRYGRAQGGARARGAVPTGRWERLTIFGGLTRQGLTARMTLAGAPDTPDTPAAVAFTPGALGQTLTPGQVVVMDNLAPRQAPPVRAPVEQAACRLVLLPPYSPNVSPIELAGSKLNALRRDLGVQTRETLDAPLATLVEAITAGDAESFFRHCGHGCSTQSGIALGGIDRNDTHRHRHRRVPPPVNADASDRGLVRAEWELDLTAQHRPSLPAPHRPSQHQPDRLAPLVGSRIPTLQEPAVGFLLPVLPRSARPEPARRERVGRNLLAHVSSGPDAPLELEPRVSTSLQRAGLLDALGHHERRHEHVERIVRRCRARGDLRWSNARLTRHPAPRVRDGTAPSSGACVRALISEHGLRPGNLWRMHPDDSAIRRPTQEPGGDVEDAFPARSPDGHWLAYARYRGDNPDFTYEIVIMNAADPTTRTLSSDPSARDELPQWRLRRWRRDPFGRRHQGIFTPAANPLPAGEITARLASLAPGAIAVPLTARALLTTRTGGLASRPTQQCVGGSLSPPTTSPPNNSSCTVARHRRWLLMHAPTSFAVLDWTEYGSDRRPLLVPFRRRARWIASAR